MGQFGERERERERVGEGPTETELKCPIYRQSWLQVAQKKLVKNFLNILVETYT